jgi:pimeloyl-ACP methyl ester carboxylesterase
MKILIFVILLLIFFACRSIPKGEGFAVKQGTTSSVDGVAIAYDVRGEGDPALVFVHGWCCDRAFWREQVDAFAHAFRVATLDLGGHGASGAERTSWSITALSHDVQAVVEALGLDRVVLIGHSMGAPVSLEAARRMPERIEGVVAIDSLHDAGITIPEGMAEQMADRYEADFLGTMEEAVRSMIPKAADPALVHWVIERAMAINHQAALALLRKAPTFNMKKALAAVQIPIRCINAAPRENSGMATALETNRKYADFDAVIMEGVGHFLMLERPEEFNTRLREVLLQITSGKNFLRN